MPNTFLPPAKQGTKLTKEGVILIGDSWNMRHPLTGGGMTVAFADALVLSGMLAGIVNGGDDLSNWEAVSDVLHQWFWERKGLAPTINVLSVALYELFGASSEYSLHYGSVTPIYALLIRRIVGCLKDRLLQILRTRW